ncbi:hypothetical protein HQ520_08110 [bacterium]|nr:hypothetical protein [bacterium]
MTFRHILGLLLTLATAVGLVIAVLSEYRHWRSVRVDPHRRPRALRRFCRRTAGATLLLIVLVLFWYPSAQVLTPYQWAFKLLVSLALCFLVIAMALWDFRAVRREIRSDVEGFVKQSAQDLRHYVKKAPDAPSEEGRARDSEH